MSIRTIELIDYKNRLISNLPTRPNASPSNFGGGGLSASQMKKAYDAMPLFIIARFNELIDYINGKGDARLEDDILDAIKDVLASKVETKIEGIATLSDFFESVESGDLAKAIRVSDGKSLDETLKTIGEETITEVERILAKYEAEKLAPIVAEADILRESVSSAQSRLSRVEKKVENLGAGLKLPIIEDNDVAYTKIVPDGALPSAEVAKVGGMSYKSENLFDVSKAQIGYRCNTEGSLVKNTLYATSDYIELNGGTSYYLTNVCGNTYCSAVLFDASKAVVGDSTIGNGSVVSGVLNVGSDAKYIRINIVVDSVDINTVMVNEGSTALPYSPYFEGLRHAKVTEVKSVGVNLANVADFTKTLNNGYCFDVPLGVKVEVGKKYVVSYDVNSSVVPFKMAIGVGTATSYKGDIRDGLSLQNGRVTLAATITETALARGNCLWFRPVRFTAPTTCTYTISNVFVKVGDDADGVYTPYTESSLPIPSAVQDLPDNGIGVSATANNYIDWSERKYHRTCGVVDLGSLNWIGTGGNTFKASGIELGYKYGWHLCSKYRFTSNVGIDKTIYMKDSYYGYYMIAITDSDYTDAASFKVAMQGVMLVYELAEPEIIDISHLLPDDNFIRVEGGGTITAVNEYGLAAPTEIIYQMEVKQ